jgi:hypothetical protein
MRDDDISRGPGPAVTLSHEVDDPSKHQEEPERGVERRPIRSRDRVGLENRAR